MPKPKVKIYSTPRCIYCVKAKEFLTANNINYEEVDVAEDKKAREEMVQKTHQLGVPVIQVDNTVIIGFDKEALKKALNIK